MSELWSALVVEVGLPKAVALALYAGLVLGWSVYLGMRLVAVLRQSRRRRQDDEAARRRELDAVMRISGGGHVG